MSEVAFLHPDTIADDPNTSVLITYLLERQSELHLEMDKTLNPGEQFGYTAYHVFTAHTGEGERVSIPVLLISMMLFLFCFWNWIFTQHDIASDMGNGYCVSDCLYAYY